MYRMIIAISSIMIVCFTAALSAGGEAASQSEEQSQIPKKTREELQYLIGTWEIEGRDGDAKVQGTWSTRWAPGKHCLIRQSSHAVGDQTMTGIGVIGWDAATERITEQVFFSPNGSALLRWKVLPSGDWEGEASGFRQGKQVRSKIRISKKGAAEFLYYEKTADGEEAEVVLRKIPQKSRESAKTALPKAAREAMEYRVGKWESIGFVDGVKDSKPSSEVTDWVPGRQYCIRISASFVQDGVELHASGLVGWDADKKQLVEHWYASDGGYASFRYFLDKKKHSWVGTFTWVYGDGRRLEGESAVEMKNKDEWEWNASYSSDGKKHTWRTINRRVK